MAVLLFLTVDSNQYSQRQRRQTHQLFPPENLMIFGNRCTVQATLRPPGGCGSLGDYSTFDLP
jgi:hypothetical protein